MQVAIKHLNTTYMWDKIRVQGGAYGGGSSFDTFSGLFSFSSYRDPNLLETLANYDGAAAFLRQPIGDQDLTRSIIGVIGTIDAYRLPDAKGFTSLLWELMGDTDEARQERREQVLGASRQGLRRRWPMASMRCARTARSWCSAPRRRSTQPMPSAARSSR